MLIDFEQLSCISMNLAEARSERRELVSVLYLPRVLEGGGDDCTPALRDPVVPKCLEFWISGIGSKIFKKSIKNSFFSKSFVPLLSILRKWHVFVQKKIDFFKIQKIDFANKSHFKGIFG